MMGRELNEPELLDLFAWIDKIPLSRPKRHISRDFSDGVMAAEVVKYFFPKLVDLHNYIPTSSTQQKLSNWSLLNRKVFSKLEFNVPEETVRKITLSTAGVIEPVLSILREKIDNKLAHSIDGVLDLEPYGTKNQEKSDADIHQLELRLLAQLKKMQKDEKSRQKMGEQQRTPKFFSDKDPAFKQTLWEKEETIMALQETVEILQIKVSRLEHLVHLKDVRIKELTQHLEVYRAKDNGS